MSEDFPFEVGDKVRGSQNWGDNWVEVLCVGNHYFFGRERSGHEDRYIIKGGYDFQWERYVEPVVYPNQFMLVHAETIDVKRSPFATLADAQTDACWGCIGILHLRSDGSTEMLNPNPERSTTP